MTSLPLCLLLLLAGLTITYAAPAKPHVVELYIVVDTMVIKKYQSWGYRSAAKAKEQFKKELNNYLEEANELFKSLKKGSFSVEIRVKRIDLNKRVFRNKDLRQRKYIGTIDALTKLGEYVVQQQYKEQDVNLLFTGYDLVSGSDRKTVSGIAFTDAACRGLKSSAVIEVDGSHQLVHDIAHEIGHLLGAKHDGSGNSCSYEDGYIMAGANNAQSKNRWSFSPCSKESIDTYLSWLGERSCLLKTTAKPLVHTKKEKDILDPENICKRTIGKNSYYTRDPQFYGGQFKGDILCKALYCQSADKFSFQLIYPSEGMLCDAGKRCNQGRCVAAPKDLPVPSSIKGDCLFGDTKRRNILRNDRRTCAQIVRRSSNKCTIKAFYNDCCASCK